MKIIEFNIEQGRYKYELNEINTDFHSHPAIEFLYARSGKFTLETTDNIYHELSFATIAANKLHRVTAGQVEIELIMLECSEKYIQSFLAKKNIVLQDGVYCSKAGQDNSELLKDLFAYTDQYTIEMSNDPRIIECLQYFKTNDAEYYNMIEFLMAKVNLSESRLSHIFTADMGLSLKKYLVWSRLKKAIHLVVDEKMNLYDASLQSGFYDQAHLSKAFKQMLGLSPSGAYNSRTLQDS